MKSMTIGAGEVAQPDLPRRPPRRGGEVRRQAWPRRAAIDIDQRRRGGGLDGDRAAAGKRDARRERRLDRGTPSIARRAAARRPAIRGGIAASPDGGAAESDRASAKAARSSMTMRSGSGGISDASSAATGGSSGSSRAGGRALARAASIACQRRRSASASAARASAEAATAAARMRQPCRPAARSAATSARSRRRAGSSRPRATISVVPPGT